MIPIQKATSGQSKPKESTQRQDGTFPKPKESTQNQAARGTFQFDRKKAEAALLEYGASALRQTLAAYIEPAMNDTIPGTGNQGNPDDKKDKGVPPEFVVPLPLRINTPSDLLKIEYPRLQTCQDVPSKIPVDRGPQFDSGGNLIQWNVGDTPTPPDYAMQEAPHCPVDADPYLPWLHDVFPSVDGTKIHFIAQNKRRCKTGTKFRKDLRRLEPQVALMQPVSVERISEQEARAIAPQLWSPTHDDSTMPRYRLAPFEESAKDGQFTRFICRFHSTDFSDDQPRTIVLGETLSTFPFNYEFVSYRKKSLSMLTPKGKDTQHFWMSNLQFECPVPNDNLSQLVASSETILGDGTPTVYVDVIPIRTPPRYGPEEAYFAEGMIRPDTTITFNATERWGHHNVMPRVEASGRWENIPICHPPASKKVVDAQESSGSVETSAVTVGKKKPHLLSACLWASAAYKTRGPKQKSQTDTHLRLVEWIEFHLMVGFDHIYVFDNSGANTNTTSLAPVLDTYPASKVTRIDWPSTVCNNNIPAHDNTGERSSQYAAENSCRTRYAPLTEWIAAFDTDEYLVPMGKYTSLRNVVTDAGKKGTNILTFRSSRGKLRLDMSKAQGDGRTKLGNVTYLEAYNCDSSPLPKPSWTDRARKQVYRADYVKYHFVHYSTVTKGILKTYAKEGENWRHIYSEPSTSERVTDEQNEALMLHAKTTTSLLTKNWINRCHYQFEKKWRGCYVGFPWPNGTVAEGNASRRDDGLEYNCFVNEKVTNYWAPRLREALEKRRASLTG